MLIVLSGLAGTGKTMLADAIGRALACPVLSVDPIESAIVDAGVPRGFESGLAAYLVARTVADAQLAAGLDVVIDAANYVEPGRHIWRSLAYERRADLKIIECVVSDPDVHQIRLASRDRGLTIREPTWADVEEQRAEWTPWSEPRLVCDATEPFDRNLSAALDFLDGRPPTTEGVT